MPKILVCDDVHSDGIEILRNKGFEVDVVPDITKEKLAEVVGEYDAIIVRGRTKVTRDIIERGVKLKVIGRAGVGLDNIDVEAAASRGITVLNTPEATAQSVAELTIGFMITLARKIHKADPLVKQGKWPKKEFVGTQLSGKTLGIIGLGNIGRRVAKIARAMGMRVLAYDRKPIDEEMKSIGVEQASFEELLRNSDIISLHVPLTQETYHMIGDREFEMMKDGCFLINTARGAVIDEAALCRALKSGKLAGAALDVYEVEPPTGSEILTLDNVVCTPLIGAQTVEAQRECSIVIAEKVAEALLQGERRD